MPSQIIIDPGHGGLDNGASYGYEDEDDANLAIGYYLNYELSLAGIKNTMTREKDEDVSLEQRVILANVKNPKLFISLHCDAFHDHTVSGMTVHVYRHPSAFALYAANIIVSQLKLNFPDQKHRGIKKSNFEVLRDTTMPAVLVECEFLSNFKSREFLKEPENRRSLARVLKNSCFSYLDYRGI